MGVLMRSGLDQYPVHRDALIALKHAKFIA